MNPDLDPLSKEQDPFFLVQHINLKNTTNRMGSEIDVPRWGGDDKSLWLVAAVSWHPWRVGAERCMLTSAVLGAG